MAEVVKANLDFFSDLEDVKFEPGKDETEKKEVTDLTKVEDIKKEESTTKVDFTDEVDEAEEVDEQEDTENSDTEADDVFTVYFEDLKEKSFLDLPEDFEFKGTEESLKEAIEVSKERIREKQKEDVINSFQEFVYNNLEQIQNTYTGVDYDSINLEDVDTQKEVIKYYLQKTTKFKPEQIDKKVNQLEQFAELEEEAKSNLEELKKIDIEEKAETARQALEFDKQRKKAQKDLDTLFQKTLKETDEIAGMKINKDLVVKSLYNQVKQPDGNVSTSFNIKLQEALADPKKVIFLAHLLENNMELGKVETNKVNTKAAKTLKEKLKQSQSSTASKLKGADFDKPGKVTLADFQL